MIDPNKMMTNYEHLDAVIASLRAQLATAEQRLKVAREIIEQVSLLEYMVPSLAREARAFLKDGE